MAGLAKTAVVKLLTIVRIVGLLNVALFVAKTIQQLLHPKLNHHNFHMPLRSPQLPHNRRSPWPASRVAIILKAAEISPSQARGANFRQSSQAG